MYIVLRFGAPDLAGARTTCTLSEPIGAFNTFVLICSSVTHRAGPGKRAGQQGRRWPRAGWCSRWLLGSVFLGVKMYEYNAKFSHGIYPGKPRSRIYERADLDYGSAVRLRLQSIIEPLGQDAGRTRIARSTKPTSCAWPRR